MKIGSCKVTKNKTPIQIYLLPKTATPYYIYIVTLKF
nr:MAG TPA: hypothetical protein [Caudoviricetes sp.]